MVKTKQKKKPKEYIFYNIFSLNCHIKPWIVFWAFPKLIDLKHVKGKMVSKLPRGSPEVYYLWQWSSNCSECKNHLEGLLQHRCLGPTPSMSHLVGLGWSPGTYFSNKSLEDANAANAATLGTTPQEPRTYELGC